VADDDGVCVVPRETAAATLEKAERRAAMEEEKRHLYAAGQLSLDINDMRPRLAEKGLKYE
jgi:4-hydroxy-4-methyl-2-oxoglutarate aldolase